MSVMRSSRAVARPGVPARGSIRAATAAFSCSTSGKPMRDAISIFLREPRRSQNPRFTNFLNHPLVWQPARIVRLAFLHTKYSRKRGLSPTGKLRSDLGYSNVTDSVMPHSPACRSEEHTSELQSLTNLVCRLLLEKKNK